MSTQTTTILIGSSPVEVTIGDKPLYIGTSIFDYIVTWGDIIGNLSDQVDLQAALDTKVESIVAGTNITVDATDPLNPIISAVTGTATWGAITGTLSDQTDLQTELDGKLNLSGDTMTGLLTLSGPPTADLHAATKKYVDDSIEVENLWDRDAGNGYLYPANITDNVGIKQAVPLSTLHIGDRTFFDDGSGIKWTLASNNIYFDGAGWKRLEADVSSLIAQTSAGEIKMYTLPTGTAGGTPSFPDANLGVFIDNAANGSFVGIQTDEPEAPLHILSSQAKSMILGRNGNGDNNMMFQNLQNDWVFGQNSDEKFMIEDNSIFAGNAAFTILPTTQYVGIHTQDPRTELDIIGTIRATYTDNSVYTDTYTNALGEYIIEPSSGNVGINTDPNRTLHVKPLSGGGITLGLFEVETSGGAYVGIKNSVWEWAFGMSGGEDFVIRDVTNSNTDILRFDQNAPADSIYMSSAGYIGLGTGAPGSSLHIDRTTALTTPQFRITGQGTGGGTSDSVHGLGIWLTYNQTGNRQFAIGNSETGEAIRIVGNNIDGYNPITGLKSRLDLGSGGGTPSNVSVLSSLGVNSISPNARLHVVDNTGPQQMWSYTEGSIESTWTTGSDGVTTLETSGNSFVFPAGTEAQPGILLAGTFDSGFRNSAGAIRASIAAVDCWHFGSQQFFAVDNGAQLRRATPGYTTPTVNPDANNDSDGLASGAAGSVSLVAAGVEGIRIYSDNAHSVAGINNYETLVTADDDLPNKKYVDDNLALHTGNTSNPHNVLATQISDFDTEVANNPDVALNTTHRTSSGIDHTYINQDVTSTASPTFNKITLTPQTAPTYAEGILYYDSDKKCYTMYNDHSGVSMQIGRELWTRSCNNTGGSIINGRVVYISGVDTGCPEISLAQPDEYDKSRMLGVATETITTGNQGEVTSFGLVNDINTATLSTGPIYLDHDGALTSTKPTGSHYIIVVGVCLVSDSVNGSIFVNPVVSDTTVEVTDTNGFPSEWRTGTTMSFSDSTPDRTFSIAPTGDHFHYYISGDNYFVDSTDTVVIDDTEGLHVIYYDETTGLTALANPNDGQIDQLIRTKCLVAYIYWDATNSVHSYFADERHGISMAPDTHSYLHFSRGAQYLSGLAISDINTGGGTTTSDNIYCQFGIESGFTVDEDLITSGSTIASTVGLPIYYLDGATGNMRRAVKAGFSMLTDIDAGVDTTGRLVYNEWTGSTWQLSVVDANDFVLCHVFQVNGYDGEDKQIAVIGQEEYDNASSARAGASTEIGNILLQFPFEELVPLATTLFQTRNGITNDLKARTQNTATGETHVDWRTSELAQGVAPSDHNNLTNLQLAGTTVTWGHINDQAQTLYGVKTFNSLPQSAATPTAGADFVTKAYGDANYIGVGGVTSFNTRTGAVVPVSGDYTAAQVTNAFDKSADDLDDITDGTTYVRFLATERTKLSGIEALAEVNNISDVNATDLTDGADSTLHYHAADRNRTNHTGTQLANTISDFQTGVELYSINNVSEDTTPQLGGDLDAQDKNISGLGSVGFTQELDNGTKTTDFSVDFSTDQKQKVTLTANTITLTLDTTDVKVGNYQLTIVNGGLATLTWASESGEIFAPTAAPTLTSSGYDIVSLTYNGTNWSLVASTGFIQIS